MKLIHVKINRALVGVGMAMGRVFFGYPPRPTPNGTGFKFNKQVWDRYEIFFKPETGSGQVRVLPHSAPFTYKINLIQRA